MAKIVYDPTNNRKNVTSKGKTVKRESKNEKPANSQPEKRKDFTDEQFLAALKEIGKPASSREINDKLGIADPEVGRQLVRTRMAKLAEEGKVTITDAEKGRAARLYSIA